ncbi:MAG: hypothetical protein WAL30_04365 [Candidatus Aquirickettsiella sp.]
MSKHYLKITESANSLFQNTILSTIFVFKSNIYQIGSMFEKILAPILFPIVIIPDAIVCLFALYHFTRAKNKNLGKTFDLIHAPIKAALVFTAIFAGFSLIFVQGLFLTAIGSSVAYHVGLSIFHAYHGCTSEKNSSIRILHKTHAINNFIATTIGGIVIAGVILTMVLAPYLAATILAIAGIATASLLMLTTGFAIYRNFKNPTIKPIPANSEIVNAPASSTSISDTLNSSQPHRNSNYYYRKFRSEKLEDKDPEKDKKFLLEEIENKKVTLQRQITSSKNNFFGWFWPEKSKRQTKISTLDLLKTKITVDDGSDLFIPNQAYQSFFRKVGDTEDLIEASVLYLEKKNQS